MQVLLQHCLMVLLGYYPLLWILSHSIKQWGLCLEKEKKWAT